MSESAIEWTDVTDNIIVAVDGDGERHGWWCRKISPGCLHCYAEKLNGSAYFHGNQRKYSGDAPILKLREDIIDAWARQRVPKKHFVSSMTDVFGEWVPQSWIFRFLDGMRAAPIQTFQVLTKRAANMRVQVAAWLEARGLTSVPSNIWSGVSVEDQLRADERITDLLQIPAIRFLSVEPLLGAVRLDECAPHILDGDESNPGVVNAFSGMSYHPLTMLVTPHAKGTPDGIQWVIVGGESGPGARPCHVDWIRSVVEQCKSAGVPVFVKQLGREVHVSHAEDLSEWGTPDLRFDDESSADHVIVRLPHLKGGDWNEWPTDLRIRQFPEVRG